MMQPPPVWDELTLTLEAFLDARARRIASMRTDNDDPVVTEAVDQEEAALRAFVVKLTERGTGMAASAANGIIHKYLNDITDIKRRLDDAGL